jgi:hypothetical protein
MVSPPNYPHFPETPSLKPSLPFKKGLPRSVRTYHPPHPDASTTRDPTSDDDVCAGRRMSFDFRVADKGIEKVGKGGQRYVSAQTFPYNGRLIRSVNLTLIEWEIELLEELEAQYNSSRGWSVPSPHPRNKSELEPRISGHRLVIPPWTNY